MPGTLGAEEVRRAAKVDMNQEAVVSALRAAGASVWVLGRPTDLLVGFRSVTLLVEVKNPDTGYGKRGANKNQREFMEKWKGGPVSLVDGPEAALRALGVLKNYPEKEAA
jgi:hypothetical protein